MNRTLKLTLDILLGAVVPILVLAYLSEPLGAVPAYLISALVPVGWVVIDLLFITKRLNFITAFLGLNALVRGLLAFWFVDGFLFALKDSAGSAVTVATFGGSLLLGRPALRAFAEQSLDPRTPGQESALAKLFAERPVVRSLVVGTAMLALVHAAAGVANFLLNLSIVTVPFGTAEFNGQVATVNAVTRLALGIRRFSRRDSRSGWCFGSSTPFCRACPGRRPSGISSGGAGHHAKHEEGRGSRVKTRWRPMGTGIPRGGADQRYESDGA